MQDSRHSYFEDAFAMFCGVLLVSVGLSLFQSQQLLTGGAAGIGLLLSHLFDVSFGMCFFLVNLPFYVLAWRELGWAFTVKTFTAVTLVSALVEQIPQWMQFTVMDARFAALVGGLLLGIGMLVMFRHRASLGGVGILAFYLQSRFQIRAGKVLLGIDFCILFSSFFVAPVSIILLSVLGAAMMNLILAINHKPGRYAIESAHRRHAKANA